MDRILRFVVKQGCDVDEAWEELGIGGIEVLWSSESDEGADEIMAKDPLCRKREELLQQFSFLEEVVEDRLGEIDWVDQWETHGQGFKDGFIHLDVNDFGYETNEKSLLLQPGPGFGDLSHETTRLVLGMMAELVEGKEILDIGCGSGVLSLVAMRMGAVGVIGVDIDPLAIEHSMQNALVNGLEGKVRFCLPEEFQLSVEERVLPVVVLLNMIWSEQKVAVDVLKSLSVNGLSLVSSGVRKEERIQYLAWAKEQGWTLKRETESNGWLCFLMQR